MEKIVATCSGSSIPARAQESCAASLYWRVPHKASVISHPCDQSLVHVRSTGSAQRLSERLQRHFDI